MSNKEHIILSYQEINNSMEYNPRPLSLEIMTHFQAGKEGYRKDPKKDEGWIKELKNIFF